MINLILHRGLIGIPIFDERGFNFIRALPVLHHCIAHSDLGSRNLIPNLILIRCGVVLCSCGLWCEGWLVLLSESNSFLWVPSRELGTWDSGLGTVHAA